MFCKQLTSLCHSAILTFYIWHLIVFCNNTLKVITIIFSIFSGDQTEMAESYAHYQSTHTWD